MKRVNYFWLAGIIIGLASLCSAQDSLGDYARAARKETKPTATKTFDNDNLPKDEHLSVVGPSGDSAQAADANKATGDKAQNGDAPKDQAAANDADKKKVEDTWKGKVAEQQSRVDMASRDLDVTQREYRLRAAAFYADAGERLRNSAQWDKDEADYKKEIADKQKNVDDAKKALDDLQAEERKAEAAANNK